MNTIENKHKFKIATNSAGQRILIVDDEYRYFQYEYVPFRDFDAIFYETEDTRLLQQQMTSMLTVANNPNYYYKPLFTKPTITKSSIKEAIDGQCRTIESSILIEETRRINQRFQDLKFKIFHREPSFWTPETIFFHIICIYLVRSEDFPEWKLKRDSSLGYAIARIESLIKYKVAKPKALLQHMIKYCMQYKLIELDGLKAVLHLCPHCYENKSILNEVCPKCESIDIEEVHMIHHFKCANISSEASYLKEGKMICPKCNRELRHIGVDYDRPASMYHCNHDKTIFADPMVKSLCTHCGKYSYLADQVKV